MYKLCVYIIGSGCKYPLTIVQNMGNVKNTIELRIFKSIALVERDHQGVPRGSVRRAGVLSLH